MTTPIPSSYSPADPNDINFYGIDLTSWFLTQAPTDSIESASVTATPDGLTINPPIIVGNLVNAQITGGTAGTVYLIQWEIHTAQGRVLNRGIQLPVAANGQTAGTLPLVMAVPGPAGPPGPPGVGEQGPPGPPGPGISSASNGLKVVNGEVSPDYGRERGQVAQGDDLDWVAYQAAAALPKSEVGKSVAPLGDDQQLFPANIPFGTGDDQVLGGQHIGAAGGVASLDSNGKLPSANLPASITTGVNPRGAYNAATNTPAISSGGGGGAKGDVFVVSVAGTVAADGIGAVAVSDQIINSGTAWQRVPASSTYGTMAAQNASAVAITGGAAKGLTTLGLSNGGGLSPGLTGGYSVTLTDARGYVLAAWKADGTYAGPKLQVLYGQSSLPVLDQSGNEIAHFGSNGLTVLGAGTLGTASGWTWAVSDQRGYIIAGARASDGAFLSGPSIPQSLSVGTTETLGADQNVVRVHGFSFIRNAAPNAPPFALVDQRGYILAGFSAAGEVLGTVPGTSAGDYSPAELEAHNARAMAYSRGFVSNCALTTLARPIWQLNHIITYGQSLSLGAAGNPVRSTTAKYGNLMLGAATHSTANDPNNPQWFPVGGSATFQPLVATTVNLQGQVLTPSQVSQIAPGDFNYRGEVFAVSTANNLAHWRANDIWAAQDPNKVFAVNECGIGGRALEQLSHGATPDIFSRILQMLTLAIPAAQALGKSYGVPAIMFGQGESQDPPFVTDAASYKGLLEQLYEDIWTYALSGVLGQTVRPPFIYYQATKQPDNTQASFGVRMGQLQAANEKAEFFCCGPDYAYPNPEYGAHLSSNGYRWLGGQYAKVARKIWAGEGWKALQPIAVYWRGRTILIEHHVPVPPLVWDTPYRNFSPVTLPTKGYTVWDDSGSVRIVSVDIVGDTLVAITLGADPVLTTSPAPSVSYADLTNRQVGMLRDSDPTLSDDLYLFSGTAGPEDPGENIPALVNKPYPLWNWCLAYWMRATPDPLT